jgi:hypothetical protein
MTPRNQVKGTCFFAGVLATWTLMLAILLWI